ncbi:hypothetical protein CRU92_03915 [Arcobacter sp. FW59]|nr:hypothetical protein CRU92_03915 [Arcobacter sp. FW59]
MNRYFILLISIFFFILGIFIGKLFYDKEYIETTKIQNIEDDKKLINNQNNSEEKIILKDELPIFIKEDLEYHSINTSNLTKKDWEDFLLRIKKANLDELINYQETGESLLHLAIKNGSLSMIRKLLDMGYDINIKDKYGNTPIYYAFMNNNNLSLIKELVSNGADLYEDYYHEKKDDVLNVALRNNPNEELVNYLKENGLNFSKKHLLGLSKSYNKDYLMEHISNLDKNTQFIGEKSYFEQLLYLNTDNDVIEYMLDNNVDLQQDNEGYTALHAVAMNQKISVENIQRIIDSGVDINTSNVGNKITPLMMVVFSGDIEKTKLYLENKADISKIDWLDRTVYDFLEQSKQYKSKEDKEKVRKLLDSYK